MMRSTLWTLLLFNVVVVVVTSAGLMTPVRREAMTSSIEEEGVDNRFYDYPDEKRTDHLGKQAASVGSPQQVRAAHSATSSSVEPASPEEEKQEVSRAVQVLRQLPPPLNGVKREGDEEEQGSQQGEGFEGLGEDNSKGMATQVEETLRQHIAAQGLHQVRNGEGPYGIKYVALIAERHSGSTWAVKFLKSYFKGKDVAVMPQLCTWKHWFQDRIHEDIQAGKRPCREKQQCPACLDIQHTLVIVLWRNPYDWISAMHIKPHHAKAHVGIKDLNTFMKMRWMLGPEPERTARVDALIKARDQAPCMDNFLPWEVVPCKENDRSAIYEVDEDGNAYGNIYELRKAKIRDFNAVQKWAPFYEKVLYEDLVVENNLQGWLRSLHTKYGLEGANKNFPSGLTLHYMSVARSHMYYLNESCEPYCAMGGPGGEHARETLNRMWDTQLEGELGYYRIHAGIRGRT